MRNDKIWAFSLECLQNTLDECSSYVEVCDKLGLYTTKSQIKMISYRCKVDEIDLSKFRDNVTINKKKPNRFMAKKLDDILVENSSYYTSNNLKKKLIKYGILENLCFECGINEWNGKELVCHLDHINGISNDNRLENLRILCPNCHSQTITYANKNRKGGKKKRKLINCSKCGEKSNGKVFCNVCQEKISRKARKVERPTIAELKRLVGELGYSATGRKYGVSDNTIRKWIKNNK